MFDKKSEAGQSGDQCLLLLILVQAGKHTSNTCCPARYLVLTYFSFLTNTLSIVSTHTI
jgi:hypothetical protein